MDRYGQTNEAGPKKRGRKPGLQSTAVQRYAANARERSRMRVLATAFVELKSVLPWVPKDTKLSKLDTLKLASGYIAYLKKVLDAPDSSQTIYDDSLLKNFLKESISKDDEEDTPEDSPTLRRNEGKISSYPQPTSTPFCVSCF